MGAVQFEGQAARAAKTVGEFMSNNSIVSLGLRSLLLASSACAAFVSSGNTASAQDGSGSTAADSVEKVVVTGSRIARKSLNTANTTSVLTADQLYRTGAVNVADIFNTLPQFAPTLSRTTTTFSGAATSGLNLANLRNLGSVETLTLINGRRVPAGIVTGGQVDFNTIPSANIERIEVLTGGASAIYGADAVAGVVNIITKKNFNGFDFGASYGVSEFGDNINPQGYAMAGVELEGKGFASVTAQYEFQGLVSCKDRYLCAEDFFWNPPGAQLRGPAAYSGVPPQGRFFVDPGNALTGQDWTLRTGTWVTPFAVAVDGYNRNPKRTIAQPTSRLMLAAESEYEVRPRITAFMELNYGSSKTDSAFEGNPFTGNPTNGIGGPVPSGGIEVTIPFNNPFIPTNNIGCIVCLPATPAGDAQDIRDAMAARGDGFLTWNQRFDAFGLRGADNLRQTVRAVGGLKGEFDTLFGIGSDWNWEASYVYGRTSLDSITEGLVDLTRLYAALRVESSGVPDVASTPDREDLRCVDPTQRVLGCVPINPFNGGAYTQKMIDYIAVSAGQRGSHEVEDATATLGGSLFELPAGPVQVLVGAEWRRTLGNLDYDAVINSGTVIGNIIGDSRSQNKWQELFGEAVVPILTDTSFTKELRLEGSYRSTHADGQGTFDTWKFGGIWEPFAGLKFRAVQSRAIRAPNTGEQSGFGQTFGNVVDPCAGNLAAPGVDPDVAVNCLADGFNAGIYNPPVVVQQNVGGFNFGNPAVQPEVGDTTTYGFVITPDLVPGLSLTVDRFDIEVDKQIALIGRQLIANLCYQLPAPDRATYCSKIQRAFNPNVDQLAYQNLALVAIFDEVQNNTKSTAKGVDIEIRYRTELADWFGETGDLGSLNLNAIISLFDEATALTTVPGAPAQFTDFLGYSGSGGQLERQGKGTLIYSLDGWSLAWTSRYIDESLSSPLVLPVRQVTMPDAWYHDAQVTWNMNENYTLYFGVNNVADKDPPFFPSTQSGVQALDTLPQYYDVFGRSFYAGFKVRM
jgi:iron complex outermembrane recepter protein